MTKRATRGQGTEPARQGGQLSQTHRGSIDLTADNACRALASPPSPSPVLAPLALAAFVGSLIALVFIGTVIYVAGRLVVGQRASFGSAITIAFLGVALGGAIGIILPAIGWVVALAFWIYLIKRFFSCGWLAALGIGLGRGHLGGDLDHPRCRHGNRALRLPVDGPGIG